MISVHLRFALDPGGVDCMDLPIDMTLEQLVAVAAERLNVEPDDIILAHDDSTTVGGVAELIDGSVVEARPSSVFEAKQRLRAAGVGWGVRDLCDTIIVADDVAGTEVEKVGFADTILTAGGRFDCLEPLHISCCLGYQGLVALLAPHCDVNREFHLGRTALLASCLSGKVGIVSLLLSHGADPNIADDHGKTPLIAAAEENHLQVLTLLLHHGADPNTPDGNGWTPIFAAAEISNIYALRALHAHGADPNQPDRDGMHPLHHAASHCSSPIIEELLSLGADIKKTNRLGLTAMDVAQLAAQQEDDPREAERYNRIASLLAN